jgi:DNA-binding CsgD family transcriptional regulator
MGKSTFARRVMKERRAVVGRCVAVLADRSLIPLCDAVGAPLAGPTDEVAAAVVSHIEDRALIVEDVQWADGPTLEVLAELVDRIPMLVTGRCLPEVLRRAGVQVLEIPPLVGIAAHALVRRTNPHLDADQSRRLVRLAGGNPLLLTRLPGADRIAPTLAEAVADRITGLHPALRRALFMLAVHGRPVAASLIGLEPDELANDLLIAEGDTVAFAHDEIAAAILGRLATTERAELHRTLASMTEPADSARHLLAIGDQRGAAEQAVMASQATDDLTARADLLAIAARATAEPVIVVAAMDAALVAHRPHVALELMALHDGTGAEAELTLRRARAHWMLGALETAIDLLDGALDAGEPPLEPAATRLVVERALLTSRLHVSDPATIGVAEESLAHARRTGLELPAALCATGLALSHNGRPGWREHFEEAQRIAAELGDTEQQCAAGYWLISSLGFYGPMAEAASRGAPLQKLAESLQLTTWRDLIVSARVMHQLGLGRLPDSLRDAAVRLHQSQPGFRNRAQLRFGLVIDSLDRDDVGGAVGLLGEASPPTESAEDRALWCCAALELALHQDDTDAAAAALDEIASCGPGFFGLNALAESAAIHLFALFDQKVDIPHWPNSLTPVLDVVAVERRALESWWVGDRDDAVKGFTSAADTWAARCLDRLAIRARATAADLASRAGRHEQAARLLHDARRASATVDGLHAARLANLAELIPQRAAAARLTLREREVLALLAAGRQRQAIGQRLGITLETVDDHLSSATRKLGARTRSEALASVARVLPVPPARPDGPV